MALIRIRNKDDILAEDILVLIEPSAEDIASLVLEKVSQILSNLHINYDADTLKELVEMTIPPKCLLWPIKPALSKYHNRKPLIITFWVEDNNLTDYITIDYSYYQSIYRFDFLNVEITLDNYVERESHRRYNEQISYEATWNNRKDIFDIWYTIQSNIKTVAAKISKRSNSVILTETTESEFRNYKITHFYAATTEYTINYTEETHYIGKRLKRVKKLKRELFIETDTMELDTKEYVYDEEFWEQFGKILSQLEKEQLPDHKEIHRILKRYGKVKRRG